MKHTFKINLAVKIMLLYFLGISQAYALDQNFKDILGGQYKEVRASLISQGWKPVANKKIEDSSIYAQEISSQGFAEVLDCISMERDQCDFLLQKNQRYIVVKTKEKNLTVERIQFKRK